MDQIPQKEDDEGVFIAPSSGSPIRESDRSFVAANTALQHRRAAPPRSLIVNGEYNRPGASESAGFGFRPGAISFIIPFSAVFETRKRVGTRRAIGDK